MGRNLSKDPFFFALHLILGEKWDEIWVWQFQILIYVHLKFSEVSAPTPLSKILRTLLPPTNFSDSLLIVYTSFKKQLPNQNRSLVAVAMIRSTKAVQRDIPQPHNTDDTEKLRRAYSITNS